MIPGRSLLERVHVLAHKVAGDGFLLAQDIRDHLKLGPRAHHDLQLIALLLCLEEFATGEIGSTEPESYSSTCGAIVAGGSPEHWLREGATAITSPVQEPVARHAGGREDNQERGGLGE
jgi:hypothetical protein